MPFCTLEAYKDPLSPRYAYTNAYGHHVVYTDIMFAPPPPDRACTRMLCPGPSLRLWQRQHCYTVAANATPLRRYYAVSWCCRRCPPRCPSPSNTSPAAWLPLPACPRGHRRHRPRARAGRATRARARWLAQRSICWHPRWP